MDIIRLEETVYTFFNNILNIYVECIFPSIDPYDPFFFTYYNPTIKLYNKFKNKRAYAITKADAQLLLQLIQGGEKVTNLSQIDGDVYEYLNKHKISIMSCFTYCKYLEKQIAK